MSAAALVAALAANSDVSSIPWTACVSCLWLLTAVVVNVFASSTEVLIEFSIVVPKLASSPIAADNSLRVLSRSGAPSTRAAISDAEA